MFNRFVKDARKLAAAAQETARDRGSATVEAEHLLMALTERSDSELAALLAHEGLDRDGAEEAIRAESERSLAAVGVSADAFDLPVSRAAEAEPRWAASAKLALERSLKIAAARKDHRIEPAHVLLGVLDARHGTVPRALELAGVDRKALCGRVAATLRDD